MAFSVGLFEFDEVSALLGARDVVLLGVVGSCDRVSVWSDAAVGWRADLVRSLLTDVLREAAPLQTARLGRGRRSTETGLSAVESFISSTEPSCAVHERFALSLAMEGTAGIYLLSDVDGQALDVLVAGDPSQAIARQLADHIWHRLMSTGDSASGP
jgi:hypothetical protein